MEKEYQKPDAELIVFDKNIKTLDFASPNGKEDSGDFGDFF
jgi:hypothetical protein